MHPTLQRLLAVGTTAGLALSTLVAAAPTAQAAEPDATKAANYLVKHLPTKGDGAAASMTAALGLATTGDCTYAPAARTLVKQIESNAKSYLYPSKKLNQARAANLSIVVSALGLNPRRFAGYNLVALVTKSLPKNGQIGASKSAFSQSLGIIARTRSDADIPVTVLTNLLSQQDEDGGAFGYEWPAGTFNADPDTTAMALLALQSIGQLKPQLNAAIDWATTEQTADGYWTAYSPVDSTGLVGSALKAAGDEASAAKAKTWLGALQHADGGFPNSLDEGTDSNVAATANALWLITGTSLLDVSLNLGKCPANPPTLPRATTACTGVWVVVDRGNGQDTVRCATTYRNGVTALKSAGFTVGQDTSGYVNRVHGFPYTIDTTFAKYWGYWYASPKPDGTWGDWQAYNVGANDARPKRGDAEGWFYGGFSPIASLQSPPNGYATASTPEIAGTAKKGQTLTVSGGTWTPTPDKLAYQWYRSGKAISKATTTSYKLASSDVGKTITVKVTASGSGLQTVSRTSAPTAKVAK